MPSVRLGFSPCPNDTFIFHALIHGLVTCPAVQFRVQLEDVETLNRLALQGVLDLTKVSYHALGHLRRDYVLLRSGGALGRGCGPLLVAQPGQTLSSLTGQQILIPGELTTASLLLQLFGAGRYRTRVLPFDHILPALLQNQAAAGVIIHESRFTYADQGLQALADLGQWWEEQTGLPIPLGGILARRNLPTELIHQIETALRASVDFAYSQPQASADYIRQHAQELSEQVTRQHIALYVNAFSRDLGAEGELAVTTLLQRAEQAGLVPSCKLPLFATTP